MWAKLLTAVGIVFTLAGLVFAIWLQIKIGGGQGFEGTTVLRLELALQALPAVGIGLLVIAVARILAVLDARPSSLSELQP